MARGLLLAPLLRAADVWAGHPVVEVQLVFGGVSVQAVQAAPRGRGSLAPRRSLSPHSPRSGACLSGSARPSKTRSAAAWPASGASARSTAASSAPCYWGDTPATAPKVATVATVIATS